MDKEFLKKYKLQEAVKRFQQINEYTFITSPVISEDGEDEENQDQQNSQQQQDNMGGNDGQMPPIPQQPQSNGTQQQDTMDDNMGGNVPTDGMNDNGGNMPLNAETMSQQPMDDSGNEMEDTDEVGSDDTIIDVDDLTNSQEATEYKIDGVDDKLTRMLSVLNKFSAALEASDKKIDDLRQEFEKRNPSEQEKLNIRSQASYPYSETPKDYWDAKTATNPHYNVMYDNDVSTAEEQNKFDITKDDLKGTNYKSIADSFDIDNMKLDDFMKF